MPSRYPPEVRRQVVELARSGTRVKQLAATFAMSEATIYNWLKQDRIDRGEHRGRAPIGARARRREAPDPPARDRAGRLDARSTRSSSSRTCPQKALPGDRVPDRAGNQRAPRLPHARGLRVGLLRLEEAARRSPRTLRRIWLAGEIADVHKASGGTYGALRVTAELRYGREIIVGHNAVESIMRELGIKGLPNAPAAEGREGRQGRRSLDLVRRAFRRDAPDRAVDDRHHRAPDPRGQGLLLRRARRVLAAASSAGRSTPPRPRLLVTQRARDGDPTPRAPRAGS